MRTSALRRLVLPAAALVVLAGLVLAGYLAPRGGARPVATPAAASGVLDSATPASRAEVERLIRVFEARVRATPTAPDLAYLARLYQLRGKLTGDLATYLAADAALTRAERIAPKDEDVLVGLAASKGVLHDFGAARALALQVLGTDPARDDARATLVDADIETGRYPDARTQLAILAHRVPGAAPVLARQARLAFLLGDVTAARTLAARAAKNAVDTATFGTSLAYYSVLQGQIELDSGHYATAVGFYRTALRAAPGWHTALAGLARATEATGDLAGAAAIWVQAIAVVPQPEYLAALGDVDAALGRSTSAQQQWATVEAAGRVSIATGQVYNRQLVLFDADHGRSTADAVRMARAELSVRKDAAGYDALAWALHADGQDARALAASRTALSWGTPDPRFWLHAGFAAAGAGDRVAAVAYLQRGLAISPHVDPLLVPRAQRLLASLIGGGS